VSNTLERERTNRVRHLTALDARVPMTIRGGGNPHSAMAAMPLREWTRRLGALPAEAYDCFMVWTAYGFNRIQAWFARLIAANGRLPSDHRAANYPIAGSLPPCSRPAALKKRRP
jgi:hypothetical protein